MNVLSETTNPSALRELLAIAEEICGGKQAARRWLHSPGMALNRERPIDVLESPGGADLVRQLLGRLECGVYT